MLCRCIRSRGSHTPPRSQRNPPEILSTPSESCDPVLWWQYIYKAADGLTAIEYSAVFMSRVEDLQVVVDNEK